MDKGVDLGVNGLLKSTSSATIVPEEAVPSEEEELNIFMCGDTSGKENIASLNLRSP